MDTLLHVGLSNALLATLLALVTAGVCAVWRRPALAHGLWLLVLLKLLTPPLVPVSLPRVPGAESDAIDSLFASRHARTSPAPDEPPADEAELLAQVTPEELEAWAESPFEDRNATAVTAGEEPSGAPAPGLSEWLKPALVVIWLAGSVGWLALAVIRVGRFRRLLRHGRPAPPELQADASAVARRLGLADCPRVFLVPGAVSPMVWFLAGPARLLLPAELLRRLDRDQRDTLLAHELAHLYRRDHWVRLLEVAATGLYWWHPVVWWARRELREAEEQCCDAWVVWALPGAARAYATALLETVDFLSEARPALPPAASGIGHVTFLKRRLTMIMQAQTPRTLSWVGFLAVLGLGAVLLPAWVQAEPPAGEPEGLTRELRGLADRIGKGEIQVDVNVQLERLQDLIGNAEKDLGAGQELAERLTKKLASSSVLKELNKKLGDMNIELALSQAELGSDHPEIRKQLRKIEALKHAAGDQAIHQVQLLLSQADGKRPSMDDIERALRRNLRDASDEDIEKILRQIKEVRGRQDKKKGGKDGKEPSREEVERARAEVQRAREEMRRAGEQMKAAAKRMAEAQKKLAQLGIHGAIGNIRIDVDNDGKRMFRIENIKKIEKEEKKSSTGGSDKKGPTRRGIGVGVGAGVGVPNPPAPPGMPGRGAGRGAPGDRDERMRDLEKRIGDLLDEVKRMRSELRQRERQPQEPRQPRPPRPPRNNPNDASDAAAIP